MITENFLVKEITFPKGDFIKACNQVSLDFGIKGQDWFNVMCIRKGDKEVMTFRHRAPELVSFWDAQEMLFDFWEEFMQFAEDENLTKSKDGKKVYLKSDIEEFMQIVGL